METKTDQELFGYLIRGMGVTSGELQQLFQTEDESLRTVVRQYIYRNTVFIDKRGLISLVEPYRYANPEDVQLEVMRMLADSPWGLSPDEVERRFMAKYDARVVRDAIFVLMNKGDLRLNWDRRLEVIKRDV